MLGTVLYRNCENQIFTYRKDYFNPVPVIITIKKIITYIYTNNMYHWNLLYKIQVIETWKQLVFFLTALSASFLLYAYILLRLSQ